MSATLYKYDQCGQTFNSVLFIMLQNVNLYTKVGTQI
jgi:hypothetical protein